MRELLRPAAGARLPVVADADMQRERKVTVQLGL